MNRNDNLMLWINHNPQHDNKKAKTYSDGILHRLLHNACPELAPFNIKRTENGKPYCEGAVDFSYSHSREVYFYVVSKQGPIGLDIEKNDKKRKFMVLSERYFHSDEVARLAELEGEARQLLFYQLWSRKEAWCKLSGGVLWYYLGRSVLNNQVQSEAGDMIYITDLKDIRGFAGALATTFPVNSICMNTIK